VCVGFTLMM